MYTVNQKIRDYVNTDICSIAGAEDLGKVIDYINDSLKRAGDYHLINEDGTRFEAIFCGESGRAVIDIGTWTGQRIENSVIVFEWYKLTTRYEINTYMS